MKFEYIVILGALAIVILLAIFLYYLFERTGAMPYYQGNDAPVWIDGIMISIGLWMVLSRGFSLLEKVLR